jgi:hypothetical protein
MDWRHVRRLALPVVVAFGLVGTPALAGAEAPDKAVKFTLGPESPFGAARLDGEYVKDDKRVYFLGFRAVGNGTDGSVWYYDTTAKDYTDTGTDMPIPVSNYGVAALEDSTGLGLYIFGGRTDTGVITDATQVYYPATDTAAVVATDPFPGETPSGCVSLPSMGVGAVSNTAVVMGGNAFVANGCVADENSAETWLFDPMAAPGSRWTQGPDLNMARGYVTPALLGKKIYAIGGDVNTNGTLVAQTIVESWKLGDASWKDSGVADLPQACDESQAFGFKKGPLQKTITLAGCGQWPNAVADVLQYNSSKDKWSNVGTLTENRRNHAGASIGSNDKPQMFIFGGYGEPTQFIDPIPSSEIGKPGKSSAPRDGARHGSPAAPTS